MNKNQEIKKIIEFLKVIEKLKSSKIHVYKSDGVQSNAAEHTWMMSLIAIIFFHRVEPKVDFLKVLKLIIVHELVEIYAGDVLAFNQTPKIKKQKEMDEKEAMEKLKQILPSDIGNEISDLWEEYNANQTPESDLAKAVDKIETLIQHNIADISTWEQGDFDLNPYYAQEYFDKDGFLSEIKDFVDAWTMKKIEKSGNLDRVKEEFLEKWESDDQNN